jgi:predicted DNA-binding transcriptional regulator YafY
MPAIFSLMRASRLVRLLGLLQARGRLTAKQLAGELEVSERTVLRDIEGLSLAGIPVYAVRGSRGGFELLDGYRTELSVAEHRLRDSSPAGAGAQRARVRLSPRGRRLAALLGRPADIRIRRNIAPAPGREDWIAASVRFDSTDSAVLDILALGPEAEVIYPAQLRRLVGQAAQRIAQLHLDDPQPGNAAADPVG